MLLYHINVILHTIYYTIWSIYYVMLKTFQFFRSRVALLLQYVRGILFSISAIFSKTLFGSGKSAYASTDFHFTKDLICALLVRIVWGICLYFRNKMSHVYDFYTWKSVHPGKVMNTSIVYHCCTTIIAHTSNCQNSMNFLWCRVLGYMYNYDVFRLTD